MGKGPTDLGDSYYSETTEKDMGYEAGQHGKEQQKTNATKSRNEEVTSEGLRRLIKNNEYRCMLSGVALDPSDASLDHSTPLSKGGEHVISNVKIIHVDVNRMKGTIDEAEFIGWCRKIAAWNA